MLFLVRCARTKVRSASLSSRALPDRKFPAQFLSHFIGQTVFADIFSFDSVSPFPWLRFHRFFAMDLFFGSLFEIVACFPLLCSFAKQPGLLPDFWWISSEILQAVSRYLSLCLRSFTNLLSIGLHYSVFKVRSLACQFPVLLRCCSSFDAHVPKYAPPLSPPAPCLTENLLRNLPFVFCSLSLRLQSTISVFLFCKGWWRIRGSNS